MEKVIEIIFETEPGSAESGILSALMFDTGAEGVVENEGSVSVFFSEKVFIEKAVDIKNASLDLAFNVVSHEPRNWNSEWEKNYQLVVVSDKVVIYAPFHNDIPQVEYRIQIHPGMAFGTGHHSTTSLMIKMMLDTDIKGKTVVDMGCGSGVLAILADKMGAKKVFAIDNDRNSYENSMKNCEINSCRTIECIEGDATVLKGVFADIIIANITRNILLGDFDKYLASLNDNGLIILSGFLKEDTDLFRKKASGCGLSEVNYLFENEWASVAFKKTKN